MTDTSATLSPAPSSPRTAPGPLVLIVDDSEDLTDLMKSTLLQAGYQVDVAENGAVALEKLERSAPRLILLDMHMPVMDGREFTRRFREKFGRSIPIVVMTVAEDSRLRADEVGADSYLGKPFSTQELYEIVEDTARTD